MAMAMRKVGSLTNKDLGLNIKVGNDTTLVIAVKHIVDEGWGHESTVVYDNVMQLHGLTFDSDTPFTVVKS